MNPRHLQDLVFWSKLHFLPSNFKQTLLLAHLHSREPSLSERAGASAPDVLGVSELLAFWSQPHTMLCLHQSPHVCSLRDRNASDASPASRTLLASLRRQIVYIQSTIRCKNCVWQVRQQPHRALSGCTCLMEVLLNSLRFASERAIKLLACAFLRETAQALRPRIWPCNNNSG